MKFSRIRYPSLLYLLKFSICCSISAKAISSPSTPQHANNMAKANIEVVVSTHPKITLPLDAVLTVTLSDIANVNGPSKIIAQKVMKTNAQQSPFDVELPFKPAEVNPESSIIASAAIAVDNKIILSTETFKKVINNGVTEVQLTLIPALN